jgi:hypothetical protein
MKLHIPQRLVSATPVTVKIHPPIFVITPQVANVSPLPILKRRVNIMDKLKVKVKNLYPQAHACMLAIVYLLVSYTNTARTVAQQWQE